MTRKGLFLAGMTRKGLFLAASVVSALAVVSSGTARAEGKTVVTFTGSPGKGSAIEVADSPGRSLFLDVWEHAYSAHSSCGQNLVCIADRSGPIEESSPHCTQASATLVRCSARRLRRLEVRTGDLGDRAVLAGWDTGTEVRFLLGPGADVARVGAGLGTVGAGIGIGAVVAAGGGNDLVRLRGRGKVIGHRGNDTLRGLSGPQRLLGGRGRDRISCGKGRDYAYGGPGKDRGGRGCERDPDLGGTIGSTGSS
jgi:Ca2+-binding RTX toxin-like protein